jgi:hypothetical protein
MLTEPQLVKKFCTFIATRRFIAGFTTAPTVVQPTLCMLFLPPYAFKTATTLQNVFTCNLLSGMSLDIDTNFIYHTAS